MPHSRNLPLLGHDDPGAFSNLPLLTANNPGAERNLPLLAESQFVRTDPVPGEGLFSGATSGDISTRIGELTGQGFTRQDAVGRVRNEIGRPNEPVVNLPQPEHPVEGILNRGPALPFDERTPSVVPLEDLAEFRHGIAQRELDRQAGDPSFITPETSDVRELPFQQQHALFEAGLRSQRAEGLEMEADLRRRRQARVDQFMETQREHFGGTPSVEEPVGGAIADLLEQMEQRTGTFIDLAVGRLTGPRESRFTRRLVESMLRASERARDARKRAEEEFRNTTGPTVEIARAEAELEGARESLEAREAAAEEILRESREREATTTQLPNESKTDWKRRMVGAGIDPEVADEIIQRGGGRRPTRDEQVENLQRRENRRRVARGEEPLPILSTAEFDEQRRLEKAQRRKDRRRAATLRAILRHRDPQVRARLIARANERFQKEGIPLITGRDGGLGGFVRGRGVGVFAAPGAPGTVSQLPSGRFARTLPSGQQMQLVRNPLGHFPGKVPFLPDPNAPMDLATREIVNIELANPPRPPEGFAFDDATSAQSELLRARMRDILADPGIRPFQKTQMLHRLRQQHERLIPQQFSQQEIAEQGRLQRAQVSAAGRVATRAAVDRSKLVSDAVALATRLSPTGTPTGEDLRRAMRLLEGGRRDLVARDRDLFPIVEGFDVGQVAETGDRLLAVASMQSQREIPATLVTPDMLDHDPDLKTWLRDGGPTWFPATSRGDDENLPDENYALLVPGEVFWDWRRKTIRMRGTGPVPGQE